MVLQFAFRKGFSRSTRGLERFADSRNIPCDQPTTFYPNRIADVTRRFLLSLCAPLPALQHHVSQNDDALMYNDYRIDLHKPCQNLVFFLYRSPSGWLSGREMFEDSFPFPVKFLFCKDKPVTVEKPILYHNGIPVIVPRFTFHGENFAIRCDQDTNFFCPRYLVTGAFSARRHRNFGPFAYFAISVFREVRQNAMLSLDHLWWRFGMSRLVRAACLRFPYGGSFCIH